MLQDGFVILNWHGKHDLAIDLDALSESLLVTSGTSEGLRAALAAQMPGLAAQRPALAAQRAALAAKVITLPATLAILEDADLEADTFNLAETIGV